jgi:hypothetical protein
MLPKYKLAEKLMIKLKVDKGSKHLQEPQQPIAIEMNKCKLNDMISRKFVEFYGTGHRKYALARVETNEYARKFEMNGKKLLNFVP